MKKGERVSKENRKIILDYAEKNGVKEASKKFKVHRVTISTWKHRYKNIEMIRTQDKIQNQTINNDDFQSENARLIIENKILKETLLNLLIESRKHFNSNYPWYTIATNSGSDPNTQSTWAVANAPNLQ